MSERQRGKLLEHFIAGTTARGAAELVGVNRNSARRFYHRLRLLIFQKMTVGSPVSGEVEVDESYFGGYRKGKRGRAAAGKIPVFGLLKRGGKVYTVVIPNAKTETLLPIIQQQVMPDSIVYSDGFGAYDALDVSGFKHKRVSHSKTFVNKRGHHINGIENFWNQAKRHLRRYNRIPKKHFYLFLKECEWRFNVRQPKLLLNQLHTWLLSNSKPI